MSTTTQEIRIYSVKQIIKTIFQNPDSRIQWIELLVVCEDGSSVEITLYPPLTKNSREIFEQMQRQLSMGAANDRKY